jgi:hypothetical protein
MGLGRVTSFSITHLNLHPTSHKLVNSLSKAPLVLRRTMGDFGLIRFTTAQTQGSHHLLPYNILYSSPWGPHPNGFCTGTPKWESRNSNNWDSRDFEGA